MTEFWKSNPMHWCDVCKVWMQDNKMAKLNHERGLKHKELLAKKLRDMNKKADTEKRQHEQAVRTISSLEEAAKKQFEEQKAAAEQLMGKWEHDASTGYYYNSKQRWYYDFKTSWYYGGDPPTWTQTPPIPKEALYDAGSSTGAPSTSAPSSAPLAKKLVPAGTAAVAVQKLGAGKHPQADIGGYQMPVAGRIGGAKGTGVDGVGAAVKRPREGDSEVGGGKALDPVEAEQLARREAARKRVQQRTMSAFGLT